MEIKHLDNIRQFDLDIDRSKTQRSAGLKVQKLHEKDDEDDELYDLDLRIKDAVNALPVSETGQTWNCTGGGCSRGCQTQRGQTCVRCGPTEYTTCGSCRCP